MTRPRGVRALLVLVALGLVLGVVAGGVTYAAFFDTATNPGNTFSANPDLTAPTASTSVIQKTTGGVVGYLKQGGTYRVYANASDTGNPPSGISSITADVSTISAGQNSVAMSSGGGPWTVGGTGYSYRSASLTADGALSAGTKSYTFTLSDNASPVNQRTQGGFSVIVDNTAPTGSNVQTANKAGGTAGRAENGDTATYTFSEPMDPESFIAGWDGTSTTVTVRLIQNASNDTMQVWSSANTAQLPLGSVSLGGNYVNGGGATATGSTMVMSGSSITITFGAVAGTLATETVTGTMTWTPSATPTDRAGNACSTAAVNQSTAPALEF